MHSKKVFVSFAFSLVVLLELSWAAVVISKNAIDDHLVNEHPVKKASERTLILIKPDSVQRGLIGKIIDRFETKGFKLVALKFLWPSKQLIERHYGEHVDREFYSRLVEQMISGPVVPMVWEGTNVVKVTPRMLGTSDPMESTPGTIRGDFSADVERSVIHGSHSVEAAKNEIRIWFQDNELVSWTPSNDHWMHD